MDTDELLYFVAQMFPENYSKLRFIPLEVRKPGSLGDGFEWAFAIGEGKDYHGGNSPKQAIINCLQVELFQI